MIKRKNLPSQKYLEECFEYDFQTGFLYWKERPDHHFKNLRGKNCWNARLAGKLALHLLNRDGYRVGTINFKLVFSHRAIYKMLTGLEPETILHENGNCSDNRIENLSNGTQLENMKNQKQYKNNSSGITGVSWHKKTEKWQVSICVENKQKYLGLFSNLEEAIKCRKKAEIELGFHSNHGKH